VFWPPRIAACTCALATVAACEPPPPFEPSGGGQGGGGSALGIDAGLGGAGGGETTADAGAWTADAGGSTADAGAVKPGPFTVIVLPDTQFYSSNYPAIFDEQTSWIIANRDALNIAFVLHEGDIVDQDVPRQWQNAARSLHRLDGLVPYFLTVGNHDIANAQRDSMVNGYFPVASFVRWPWFGGTFEPNHIENNYGIVSVQGASWLVLALEFGPRTPVLEWADAILSQHPDLPAMIVTHAYLYFDGTRYDHVTRPDQNWNPHNYGLDALPGGVNDGEEMWQALVSKHDNLGFVLSGHVLPRDPNVDPDTAARLTSTRESGTHCHQILANYQTCVAAPCDRTNGGDGYLRIMRIDPVTHAVSVRTYSPHLDAYKVDPDNQFDLSGD
jgi:hypothetical protein